MDMLIVLLSIICIGVVKAVKAGGFGTACQPVLSSDGSITYGTGGPPIGNNLCNLREAEPFTFILRQLGLKE